MIRVSEQRARGGAQRTAATITAAARSRLRPHEAPQPSFPSLLLSFPCLSIPFPSPSVPSLPFPSLHTRSLSYGFFRKTFFESLFVQQESDAPLYPGSLASQPVNRPRAADSTPHGPSASIDPGQSRRRVSLANHIPAALRS